VSVHGDQATPAGAGQRPAPALLRRLLDFCQLAAGQVHPSWLHTGEALWLQQLQALRQPQPAATVAAWLRQRLDVAPQVDADLTPMDRRCFLLDMGETQDLALWLGASLCASRLRRLVRHQEVAALHAALGEAGLRRLFHSFADAHDAGATPTQPEEAATPAQLYRLGAQALLACAAPLGAAVQQRTQLKLERAACEATDGLHCSSPQRLGQHMMVVAMLFLPGTRWLFSDLRMPAAA
jgi:hypothetical protein